MPVFRCRWPGCGSGDYAVGPPVELHSADTFLLHFAKRHASASSGDGGMTFKCLWPQCVTSDGMPHEFEASDELIAHVRDNHLRAMINENHGSGPDIEKALADTRKNMEQLAQLIETPMAYPAAKGYKPAISDTPELRFLEAADMLKENKEILTAYCKISPGGAGWSRDANENEVKHRLI